MNKAQIYKKAPKRFGFFLRKAAGLLADREGTWKRVNAAFDKASRNKGQLEEVWQQLQLFFSVIKDYLNGTYREIPLGSVVAILAALLYLLSPIDVVPDFLAVMGFFDDAFIIGLVLRQVSKDLKNYESWKMVQAKEAAK